ncbi:hypothetical protein YTPLAS72_22130 [Nitrospira sp.]|nr:hypothetical protein YTPLAS72_22130 [Nitrospira sp.]
MMNRQSATLAIGLVLISVVGCNSIHSDAVRDLLHKEGAKIDAAQTNIDLFQKETEERITFLEKARNELHEAFKSLRTHETKHQFVLSSYRNIASKKGEAAYAAAYLVSQIYLADYQGLEKAVWNQFEDDFCGLRDAANALNDSWKKTAALHAQLRRYADKSALASVDPEFVSALIDQAPGQSDRIMEIVNHSRTINDALEEVVGARIVRMHALQRAQTLTSDLVNLLDNLKKDDGQ